MRHVRAHISSLRRPRTQPLHIFGSHNSSTRTFSTLLTRHCGATPGSSTFRSPATSVTQERVQTYADGDGNAEMQTLLGAALMGSLRYHFTHDRAFLHYFPT